jgi:hypothetical protein
MLNLDYFEAAVSFVPAGGHYHNDLDDHQPVAYEGYFVLAEQLSRVDQP